MDSPFSVYYTFVITSIAVFLATFRLWRFTIRPLLHPEEPKELPYWIPYLGHTYAFVRSGHDVILRAKRYFNNTREPFALQLKDRKMYFIMHPNDATAVYRNTATMSFEKIVLQLQHTFQISESTLQTAWTVPISKAVDPIQTVSGVANPSLKSLADLSMDFWKIQVGRYYEPIETTFTHIIKDELAKEVVRAQTESEGIIGLLPLVRQVFLAAGMRTFFGDKLLEVDPGFVSKFAAFDDQSWKLWFRWPFSRKMFANKRRVEESLEKWLKVPREERGQLSYLIDVVEKTQRAIGTPVEDLARIFHMMIFVQYINTNTYKAAYWATAHLLKSPSIRAAVETEIDVARRKLQNSPTNNPQYLTHLRTQTPQITALFQETLRCYGASSSMRVTLAPVPIGKRIIPAKSVVFIPLRPLHFDPDVFGANADLFHHKRFVEDKKLAGSQSYKPFSSGSSHCPGRVLARMELAAFVADFLGTYSVDVEGGGDGEVPKTDKKTPTKGLLMPADGEDFTLRIRKRIE